MLLLLGRGAEPAPAQEAPEAAALIDRVIDVYGGRDRLRTV